MSESNSPATALKISDIIQRFDPQAKRVIADESRFIEFSGHYASPFKRGALSGSNIFLLPDQQYFCCEWADILPMTIIDRGTWDYQGDFIHLQTDGSITGNPWVLDRRYFPYSAPFENERELFLLGTEWRLSRLKEKMGRNDRSFYLLLHSLGRERMIDRDESDVLSAQLMADCWRPDWFSK